MTEIVHGRSGYLKRKCRCDVCREANRLYRKACREEDQGQNLPRLSADPLIRLLELDGQLEAVNPGFVSRWRAKGLTVHQADNVAVKYGYHPAMVWGDDFYVGCDLG